MAGVLPWNLSIGSLSCIIWTLTLQTTIKYVWLVLRADNNGAGGTFALFALVRRRKKWLVIPAMVGGRSAPGRWYYYTTYFNNLGHRGAQRIACFT